MKLIQTLLSAFLMGAWTASAFAPQRVHHSRLLQQGRLAGSSCLHASRRDFLGNTLSSTAATVALATLGGSTALAGTVLPASASGGATAGGAYLLSAKQRYNERVKAGVQGYMGLQAALESGNIDSIRAYFNSEDAGGWKDLTSAGYLLANAFRRNSTTPPDSLPSVKAWKKFAASVEGIAKALKKKDVQGALATYKESLVALDAYLKEVELPDAKEISMA